MHDRNSPWLIPLILTAAVAGAFWFFTHQATQIGAPLLPVPAETLPSEPDVANSVPRYPLLQPMSDVDLVQLPPLENSDEYFRLEMADLFGNGMAELLVTTAVIEKIVATVDNLPRSHVAQRMRPVSGVDKRYLADGQDGSGQFTANARNYQRFDLLVNLLASADVEAVVDMYRRFYPLFQDAYAGLGYPQAYFNDRAIGVIDHLLETPEQTGPLELVRPNVLYEYADPELEALSSGQKLLLRMGDEHAVRVKQFLEELREQIAAPAG